MSQKSMSGIVSRFGIRASRVRKIRGGIYRIATPAGNVYSLKRMPMPRARLRWVDRTLRLVRERGFPHLAWRHPGKKAGRRLSVPARKGSPYVLTPWISGRQPSPGRLADMYACGAALARFHLAGRRALSGKRTYSKIGAWPSILRARRRYLDWKISGAKMNRFSSKVNAYLQAHAAEIKQYANLSRQLLRKSGYKNQRRQANRIRKANRSVFTQA